MTRKQAMEIAEEALTRLTKCGAVQFPPDQSQDEYDTFSVELLSLIADSAQVVVDGQVSE